MVVSWWLKGLRIQCSHCCGLGLVPGSGTSAYAVGAAKKKKKKKKTGWLHYLGKVISLSEAESLLTCTMLISTIFKGFLTVGRIFKHIAPRMTYNKHQKKIYIYIYFNTEYMCIRYLLLIRVNLR